MRSKIKLRNLNELAKFVQGMNETEQSIYLGGGTGTLSDPYTWDELCALISIDQGCYYLYNGVTMYCGSEQFCNSNYANTGYYNSCYVGTTELMESTLTSGEQLLENAKAYEGVGYKYGGNGTDGIDCGGLITNSLGLDSRWTTHSGDIPGTTKCSFTGVNDLQVGDILVFPGHVAIYAGNGQIFHAHGKEGTPVGFTSDLTTYWIPYAKGNIKVYRP